MIELILIGTAAWVAVLIWKDRKAESRNDKFQEGLERLRAQLDEHPDFLMDEVEEELDWYDWVDYSTCELCDEFIYEDEAITIMPAEDGGMLVFCEYCLNPALK